VVPHLALVHVDVAEVGLVPLHYDRGHGDSSL
jgi:hypothetical protein